MNTSNHRDSIIAAALDAMKAHDAHTHTMYDAFKAVVQDIMPLTLKEQSSLAKTLMFDHNDAPLFETFFCKTMLSCEAIVVAWDEAEPEQIASASRTHSYAVVRIAQRTFRNHGGKFPRRWIM